jgi:ribosomal protein L11 methyltransferase
MKWIEAKVTFTSPDPGLTTDLIADIFYSLDLNGVVVDDPETDAHLDWGDDAIRPSQIPGVTGYFADTTESADRCNSLEACLLNLSNRTGIETSVQYTRIDEQDWAEAWKEYFWPEKITDMIVVKPSWRDYPAQPDDIILEIDPGMAFGTGTHPTTALCIQMISRHLKPGDTFLDVGTGSGILMITAAKLGAGAICGIDNDPVAVDVAGKNLLANGIDGFSLFAGNLVDQVEGRFDVVTANILAEVILDLLPNVAGVLKDGGVFIGSGIIVRKKDDVVAGLRQAGFGVIELLEKEDWVAIVAGKTHGG